MRARRVLLEGRRTSRKASWAPADFKDTELGVMMEPEVDHGVTEFTREFKLEAVKLIKERGVGYVAN